VPVLGVSNTAAGITDIGDYIFRDSLTEGDVIPQTVKKVADRVKPRRAALLFANDDAFSKSGGDVMRDALRANSIEIATEQQFSTNDRDFRAQLTAVRQANVDAIFVSALTGPATGIVTQARELGLRQPIIGGNGFNTPVLIQNAGPAAEGVIVGAAWNQASTNPKSQEFLRAYKAKFNQDPDQFAAQAYAGVYILADAVKRAGSADRAALRTALTQTRDLDTVLGRFSFNEKRDAVHPAVVQIIKDGKFTVME
jgi:branched-chain amino acid transport system substrate-binding protein